MDLEDSLINDDELIKGLQQFKNLKRLSIQGNHQIKTGCQLLTNSTLLNL